MTITQINSATDENRTRDLTGVQIGLWGRDGKGVDMKAMEKW